MWESSLSWERPWPSVAPVPFALKPTWAPALCLEVVDAHRAGDPDRLGDAFERLLRLNEVLSHYQNPRSVKAAMEVLGLPAGQLRRPYLALDADEVATIADVVAALGLSKP